MMVKVLECREAEDMIGSYISDQIGWKELECFLHHIKHCSSCREELETQYIVKVALEQLDNSQDSELDIQKVIKGNILKSERFVKRVKRWIRFRTGVKYLGISAVLALVAECLLLMIL